MSLLNISVDQVKNLMDNTELSDEKIQGCISTATVIMNNQMKGAGLTGSLKTEIAMYLAAHFVSIKDKSTRVKKERIGDAEATYDLDRSWVDLMSLKTTVWGATALQLDPSGILQQIGLKQPRLVSLEL